MTADSLKQGEAFLRYVIGQYQHGSRRRRSVAKAVGQYQGPIEVTSDQKIVLIDFDVAESFGRMAGSDHWVMDPTIKGVEITFSATVNLTVALAAGVELTNPSGFEGFTLGKWNRSVVPTATFTGTSSHAFSCSWGPHQK